MNRFTALVLFVIGYATMAALDPTVAALPALTAFTAGGLKLVPREL